MRIVFIGGGTMGEAMVKCLLAQKVVAPQDIVVNDVNELRRELLGREYKVKTSADSKRAVENADVVILAIKPENLTEVMEVIKGSLREQAILSIVAGASLATLNDGLTYPHIIRAMPNMPAQIGEGMIVWTTTTEVNQEHKKMARSILSALGKEIYFPEEKYIDMATALSGSGPAYVFLFIEVLTDAGVHIGLSHKVAKELAIQTTLGSAHMVEKVGKHPAELRNMVTSPGGTTAEALAQLEWGGFRSSILEAVIAAHEKAKQL